MTDNTDNTDGNGTNNGNGKLLTPSEAAARISVDGKYVKRMLREGKIKGIKVGKFWRITEAALVEFITNLEKANSGNGGLSQNAKDKLTYTAILRSREVTPHSIEKLNQEISDLKAALQIEDQLKKVALTSKLHDRVVERETKRMRLDEIPQMLNTLADSAYPGMRELIDEDPEALEAMFAGQVSGGNEPEPEGAAGASVPFPTYDETED